MLTHFCSSCSCTSRGHHSCVSIDWYAKQLLAFSTILTLLQRSWYRTNELSVHH